MFPICSYKERECMQQEKCLDCSDRMEIARELWAKLEDVPVMLDSDNIDEDWLDFPQGTDRIEIWLWFEETFNVSIAVDLMNL